MTLTSYPSPESIPILPIGTTEAEKAGTWLIIRQLSDLAQYETTFASAVRLFDFCQDQMSGYDVYSVPWDYVRWQNIAVRDGAITAYHFGKTTQYLRISLKTCPLVDDVVDQELIKQAGKLLRSAFPRFEALRHVVAHEADFVGNDEVFLKHAVDGPAEMPGLKMESGAKENIVLGIVSGRNFSVTFESKPCTYELSGRSLEVLGQVRRLIYQALAPAEKLAWAHGKGPQQSGT